MIIVLLFLMRSCTCLKAAGTRPSTSVKNLSDIDNIWSNLITEILALKNKRQIFTITKVFTLVFTVHFHFFRRTAGLALTAERKMQNYALY